MKYFKAGKFDKRQGQTKAGSRIDQGRSALTHAKRWKCNLLPGDAVARNTKSEAIAWFKDQLGVNRIPPHAIVESF